MYRLIVIQERQQFLVMPVPDNHPRFRYVRRPSGQVKFRWIRGPRRRLQKSAAIDRTWYRLFTDFDTAVEAGRRDLLDIEERSKQLYQFGIVEDFTRRCARDYIAKSDARVGSRLLVKDISKLD